MEQPRKEAAGNMTTYRVYGPARSQGSFGTLARGFLEGLRDLGREVHLCPTDLADDEEVPGAGSKADVAIHVGNPLTAAHMVARGVHQKRFTMLAPNSTNIPSWVFDAIDRAKATIICPSSWASHVVAARRPIPEVPMVVHHGLGSEYADDVIFWPPRTIRPRILHVTNTAAMRKQSQSVIDCWEEMKPEATLLVKCDAETRSRLSARPTVTFLTDPVDSMVDLYASCDVTLQPSRVEGFGLVPLESVACGTPCVIGATTGCMEYAYFPGIVTVQPGRDEWLDDEAAMAPTVSVRRAIELALDIAGSVVDMPLSNRQALHHNAYERWCWKVVLRDFVDAMEGGRI